MLTGFPVALPVVPVALDLKEVLRWHIYECIARGEDISPYVKEEGRVADSMKFKITFDTT